jgi:hypothetical protein
LKLSRAEVLGRVPLIPCYLNGNSVNVIPRSFRGKIKKEATADSRSDSGTGSRLFINIEFVESISWGLNQYRIINIDIEAKTSISK